MGEMAKVAVITYHSRQKRNVICSRDFCVCSPFEGVGGTDMLTIIFDVVEV